MSIQGFMPNMNQTKHISQDSVKKIMTPLIKAFCHMTSLHDVLAHLYLYLY